MSLVNYPPNCLHVLTINDYKGMPSLTISMSSVIHYEYISSRLLSHSTGVDMLEMSRRRSERTTNKEVWSTCWKS